MTHDLKSWPGSFDAVASGAKKHEIRKADRPFAVGDDLVLREWNLAAFEAIVNERMASGGVAHDAQIDQMKKDASARAYTGRTLLRKITYISIPGSWGLPDDICILSIE